VSIGSDDEVNQMAAPSLLAQHSLISLSEGGLALSGPRDHSGCGESGSHEQSGGEVESGREQARGR
jgi:hypothetical protein